MLVVCVLPVVLIDSSDSLPILRSITVKVKRVLHSKGSMLHCLGKMFKCLAIVIGWL